MSSLVRLGRPRSPVGDWWKILGMGVVLAALVYVVFWYEPPAGLNPGGPPVSRARVAVPEIDTELLRSAKDATHSERLVLELEPLAHLLEKSLDVVPTVAAALGMPKEPIPVTTLRALPATYRGAYLWYRGELKYLSPGKSGHPVDGYRIYEGWIETPEKETVSFRVSVAPTVKVGDFVRVEGFFLKLLDGATTTNADQVPLLIGPELFPDFRPWDPVTKVDPAVFASLRDGVVENGKFVDFQDATDSLERSQDVPLWTLASYATHEAMGADNSFAHWRKVPAFVAKNQLDEMKVGKVAAGTPCRLLGTFIMGEWFEARPNPAGIEYWSQAWIQIRDLGGKLVPVWIPKKINDLKNGASLEVRAYYFRRFIYDVEHTRTDGPVRETIDAHMFTPVFVAADLTPFELGPQHPVTSWARWVFFGVMLLLISVFVRTARRDRRTSSDHETAMIERRRRRRGRGTPELDQEAGATAPSTQG